MEASHSPTSKSFKSRASALSITKQHTRNSSLLLTSKEQQTPLRQSTDEIIRQALIESASKPRLRADQMAVAIRDLNEYQAEYNAA